MEKIKIIIVDDFLMVRTGLSLFIRENKNMEIIAEATDGEDFLRLLNKHTPDIVLMDINMPGMDGIEATKEALLKQPDLKIIALTMYDSEDYIENIMQAGARGYILKKVGAKELYDAIGIVMSGERYISQEIMNILSKKLYANHDSEPKENLNIREKEILGYLCMGFSTSEIAEKFSLSPRTVECHRYHLLKKTNTKNTVNLVLYAIKSKLFPMPNEI